MKKKILIPIVPIIIAIVLLILIIMLVLNNGENQQGSKLNKVYENMIINQTYAFTRYDLGEEHKITTYRKIDKTLIDMYNPGEHSSTLILDGDMYLISHENKEYYVYPNNNLDQEVLTDTLKEIVKKEYTTGKEKIYGKAYNYEEYNGVSDFLFTSSRYIDSVKTRFYFKGNELVYLKTIYDIVDEETGEKTHVEQIQTVKVEYEVQDNIFNIPEEYAEG